MLGAYPGGHSLSCSAPVMRGGGGGVPRSRGPAICGSSRPHQAVTVVSPPLSTCWPVTQARLVSGPDAETAGRPRPVSEFQWLYLSSLERGSVPFLSRAGHRGLGQSWAEWGAWKRSRCPASQGRDACPGPRYSALRPSVCSLPSAFPTRETVFFVSGGETADRSCQ